jgi:broad specificity phosphatase PhoE
MYLVRHGETAWAREGRHTGRTDVALLDSGRAQAEALGRRLADHRFALVLSSPSSRAYETGVAAGFGERAERTEDLLEWHYGAYEGLTTDEIRLEHPGWTLWGDGVPEGESAADVGRRCDRVIERARALTGDTLCFAHGHVLRVLAARWVSLPPAGGRLWRLDPGALSLLGWEREVPVVTRWNEPAQPIR